MLLVVVGAGASYDSAPSRPPTSGQYSGLPNRPPLANQLFDDRPVFGDVMNKYPKCLDIAPWLRHLPENVSIESVLQHYQSEIYQYPDRIQQLASIRYYLQEILTKTVDEWERECQNFLNHRPLLDTIKRWRKPGEKVCFVSFNYDMLIERALWHAGYPKAILDDYIAGDIMLVKLHGSVNWGRVVATPCTSEVLQNRDAMARDLINRYENLNISKEYVINSSYPPSSIENRAVFPALAIPVESKLEFECPSEHVDALRSFIPGVTKILIIGWRATEAPFLEMLKRGLVSRHAQIMIVNGRQSDAQDTAKRLQGIGISGSYTLTNGGFTEFVIDKQGEEFFSTRVQTL